MMADHVLTGLAKIGVIILLMATVLAGTIGGAAGDEGGAPEGATVEAGARPNFQMPFPCNESWYATTYSGHAAIDWNKTPTDGNGDAGRSVVASASGTATTFWDTRGGRIVDVNHGGGWVTRYAHLLEGSQVTGSVRQGQRIGRVGNTGSSTTAAHLHWEQRRDGVRQSTLYANGSALGVNRYHTSRNCGSTPPPTTRFSNDAVSRLRVTSDGQEIRLSVCANNIVGQRVVVRLSRPAVSGSAARSWTYEKRPSSRCVEFTNMEGPGAVLRNVTYTSRAALNQSPSSSWPGGGCYAATGGQGLCDQVRR